MQLNDVLKTLGEHTRDGIVVTKAEPIRSEGPEIVWVNDAMTRITGFSFDEIVGATPRIFQGENTSEATRQDIRKTLEQWKSGRFILQNYTKDGAPFWVEIDIKPVADEKGWFHYWVATQRDVTETMSMALEKVALEKAINASTEITVILNLPDLTARYCNAAARRVFGEHPAEAFRQAAFSFDEEEPRDLNSFVGLIPSDGSSLELVYAPGDDRVYKCAIIAVELEAKCYGLLIQARDVSYRAEMRKRTKRVIASVSHEFRTPLSSIQATLDLVSKNIDRLETDKVKYLTRVALESCRDLQALVSDLVDVQLMAADNFNVSRVRVDVGAVLGDALESLAAEVGEAGVEMHVDLPDTPVIERVDAPRILRGLEKLIGNAVRFSDPMKIEAPQVWVSLTRSDAHWIISVRDNGIGMPRDKLDQVFDAFSLIDDSDLRTARGAGVGLAIVKRIASLHHGRVEVESTLGEGSVFRMIFEHETEDET